MLCIYDHRYAIPEDTRTPFFFPELKVMEYFKSSRLLKERSYARREPFLMDYYNNDDDNDKDKDKDTAMMQFQPTIQDLASPPTSNYDKFWVSSWFRIFVFSSSWTAFPFVTQFLYAEITGESKVLGEDLVVSLSSFLPAISLIYGTNT